MTAIDPNDKIKLNHMAETQYAKFKMVLEKELKRKVTDQELKALLEKDGAEVDLENKRVWTPMTTGGQVTNYELNERGHVIGYMQIMDRNIIEDGNFVSGNNQLESERAFGVKLADNAVHVTDLSPSVSGLMAALNTDLITTNMQDSLTEGLLVYTVAACEKIMQDPAIIGAKKIDQFSAVIPQDWVSRMAALGLLEGRAVVQTPNRSEDYYGFPIETIKVAIYDRELLQSAAKAANNLTAPSSARSK